MGLERAHCKHCGLRLPRIALAKLDWICRGCGSRLRKSRWIDLSMLVLAVIAFIALIISSGALFIYLFESVLRVSTGWGVGVCVVLTIGLGFGLYAFAYPYLSFHGLKEARPHCVKCMYPVEEKAEACPECGEVVPWNHSFPKEWTHVRFGRAQCNCCGTIVPRSAHYEKGGQWVCKGCGVTLIQPPYLYALGNNLQTVATIMALLAGGVVSLIVMPDLFPDVLVLIWFILGAVAGVALVMSLQLMIFPLISPYIVKDARVHCGECGTAVPDGMQHCPSCTRAVRYSITIDRAAE